MAEHAEVQARELLARAGLEANGSQPHDPHIHDPRVYRRVMLWGSVALGDSYVAGLWDCERLDVFFERVLTAQLEYKVGQLADTFLRVRDWLFNLQSVRRAFQVGQQHYDVGNDLYEVMLGESMAYSSAYFHGGITDLTQAQYAKFDLLCRQLALKPGMRVLEIGSGWGTFAAYAHEKYGVEVLGVTVSKEQLEYAQKRCAGMPITFYFGDYRTLPAVHDGTFDRVVSIEMIEAVGLKNMRAYMEVAHRALKAGGSFGLQAILGNGMPDVWLSTRIFPNGVLPGVEHIERAVTDLFSVGARTCFGGDYDKTLLMWEERFRNGWEVIRQCVDERGAPRYDQRFYRLWRYYLLVCAGAFRAQKIDVCQLHLIKQ